MSDYLWDKKGDPDTEVARLEALLGAFKHAPRPLELPAEAAPPEPRPASLLPFAPRLRASRLFAPAALAAAAALLVASVLVASAFLRARVANVDDGAAAREAAPSQEGAPKDEGTAPREAERAMLEPPVLEPPAHGGVVKDQNKIENLAVRNLLKGARQRKDVQLTVVPPRRRQKVLTTVAVKDGAGAGGDLTLEAMRAPGGASAFVESTRLLTKEQLIYALRLTGAKLKDVRQRAQGTEAEGRPLRRID
jgi:hypothetical protein